MVKELALSVVANKEQGQELDPCLSMNPSFQE